MRGQGWHQLNPDEVQDFLHKVAGRLPVAEAEQWEQRRDLKPRWKLDSDDSDF